MRPTFTLFASSAKSGSSKQWLARQARDPFVKARAQNAARYRARSAFKLLQLNDHYKLFGPNKTNVAIDLGAAPGGWSQVVADALGVSEPEEPETIQRSNEDVVEAILAESALGTWSETQTSAPEEGTKNRKTIISLDVLPIKPLRGVRTVRQDFLDGGAELVASLLPTPDTKADLILSDIAPNMSGNKTHDSAAGLEICQAVYAFAAHHLKAADRERKTLGGHLVLKYFANESTKAFYLDVLKPVFHHIYTAKPDASRAESNEYYFVCKSFHGDKRIQVGSSNKDELL
ncbi:hypothetical protein EW145_g2808 [Phellinidium pouzarii]|uniref:rRNA methyltransferase 2, mitochondrial n=1 Tax=Phellinidium pouzarii TaxID=167371 RepID=A0A4S4L9W6_9AGAM|nr:hypothetical protein EW145_g2808 [Phellinidium pouzarii]